MGSKIINIRSMALGHLNPLVLSRKLLLLLLLAVVIAKMTLHCATSPIRLDLFQSTGQISDTWDRRADYSSRDLS